MALVVKNLAANAGEVRDTGRSLGGEDPLEESAATIPVFLSGESMDRGAWWAIVPWVEKSQKRLKQLNTARIAQRSTWRYLLGNLGRKAAALAPLIWVHPPGNE